MRSDLAGKHRRGELRELRAIERIAPDRSEELEERVAGRVTAESLRRRLAVADKA